MRMRLVVIEERLRVVAQSEEVAALFDALDRLLVDGAEVALEELLFGLEGFAPDTVPILVVVEIDVAPRAHELPKCLDVFAVLSRRRADEAVVGALELLPGQPERCGHPIDEVLRGEVFFSCTALDLQAVLVEARQEVRRPAAKALIA
jgi:hypothetical protein